MIMNLSNYPVFAPNQVLTDEDLNGLVNYLEGLNQFSRVFFVGMGIAYGLTAEYASDTKSLKITPGCGITSEGYVVQMNSATGTNTDLIFQHYRETTIAKNLFIPSDTSQQTSPIKELMQLSIADSSKTDIRPLTDEVVEKQVVVVLYDWQDIPRLDTCRLDYDQQTGKNRRFRLRFFLLPPTAADDSTLSADLLLRVGYQIDQLPEPWKTFRQQKSIADLFEARQQFVAAPEFALQVQRFGYTQQGIDLTTIQNYQKFKENYFQICQTAIAAIGNAFPELYRLFSPFFGSFNPNTKQDFQALADSLSNRLQQFDPVPINGEVPENTEPAYTLQYFYDYLSQLVAAYTELVEVAFDLMDDAKLDTRRFPQFLMLGQLSVVNAADPDVPSAYRSQFIQPRIYNNSQQRLQQVRHLYQRLLDLTAPNSFVPLPFYRLPIKITPGRDPAAALRDRTIPAYLNYGLLSKSWNYDAYRKGRSDRLPSYANSDLTHRLDTYNFYRIEGHLGRANAEALKTIQDYQQQYNLPFDVITLKLGSLSSFQDLNLSVQLESLNETFQRLKDKFSLLWSNNEAWANNVVLTTLNQIFFSKMSLAEVNPDRLVSRLLERAKSKENYQFNADQTSSDLTTYQLFLKNADGSGSTEVLFRNVAGASKSLDFDALVGADVPLVGRDQRIKDEQAKLIQALQDAFDRNKLTYRVDPSSKDTLRFNLYYISSDQLSAPLGDKKLEPATVELRDSFTIKTSPPVIQDNGCPDIGTLHGLLRDVPQKFTDDNSLNFDVGNPDAAQALGQAELLGLLDSYQQQLDHLIQLHLFHSFAQQHPGIEPLGGVPKGGTFILVYADGQDLPTLLTGEKNQKVYNFQSARAESLAGLPDPKTVPSWELLLEQIRDRKDIVVADFCLPYRSSSTTSAVSYVLARPRPIILLSKLAFCTDDTIEYDFILEPEGGIVKGEGVGSEQQRQFFQPSLISAASKAELAKGNEVSLTFSYAIDDSYDTLTVTVYPQPQAELTVAPGQTFCRNNAATEIGLAPETPDYIELVSVQIDGVESKTLLPSTAPDSVQIAALVRDLRSQCTNTISRTIRVYPLPEADLSIVNNQTFCQNAAAIEITLAEDTPTDLELVQVTINGSKTTTFNPAFYATKGQPETVTLIVTIRDRTTQCTNLITRTVTVNPLPQATLSIANIQSLCKNAAPIEITLAEGTPALVELVQVTINGTVTTTLDPAQHEVGSVTIAARIRNSQTQCETTLLSTVTIKPLPDAAFQLGSADQTVFSTRDQSVTLIPNQPGGTFQAHIEERDISAVVLEGMEFFPDKVQFNPDETQKTVALGYTVTQNDCTNTAQREITVILQPEIAALNLVDPNEASNPRLLQDGMTFSPSDFVNTQFAAEAMGKVGSVVFTYTSPGQAAQRVAPTNTVPYLMLGNWEPTIGTHTIAAQPFSAPNATGIAGAVQSARIIIIEDEEPQDPTPITDGDIPQDPTPITDDDTSQDSTPSNPPSNDPPATPVSPVTPPTIKALLSPPSNPPSNVPPTIKTLLSPFTAVAQPAGFMPFAVVPMQPETSQPETPRSLPPSPSPEIESPLPEIAPRTVESSQPRRFAKPNLIQVAAFSAIATLLSLIWVYTAKPPVKPQPSANPIEQPKL